MRSARFAIASLPEHFGRPILAADVGTPLYHSGGTATAAMSTSDRTSRRALIGGDRDHDGSSVSVAGRSNAVATRRATDSTLDIHSAATVHFAGRRTPPGHHPEAGASSPKPRPPFVRIGLAPATASHLVSNVARPRVTGPAFGDDARKSPELQDRLPTT